MCAKEGSFAFDEKLKSLILLNLIRKDYPCGPTMFDARF
jgi:hypothetical protein